MDTRELAHRMNIALWIVQVILCLGFLFSGWLKAFQQDKASWPWVKDVSKGLVAFIGVVEIIGAFGLIIPQATDIAPVLTPLAAIGLGVIVLLGAFFHIKRKEYKDIGVNILFLALATFVAIGRL